jgi:hypothetical protein
MPVTVFHSLSATTPDNTAYEIRPSHWNSGHAASIAAVGSEISGAFSNGGNVTFGLSANGFITASAPAGGGGALTISGAGSSISNGQLIFSNSNGVSFGMNGSTMTASVAAAGGAQTGISGISAGTQLQTVGTLQFLNSNGMTFGMSNSSQITASYTVPTVPTSYVSNINGSSGAMSLAVGSSLSSSTAGSTITFGLASNITTALQSAGAYLTTAAQSSLSNVSQIIAATNNTGGGTATLTGGISFSNANSMTFYTSAGNAIVGSFSTSQSVQTQASGNIARTGVTTGATAGSLLAVTHDTAGLSIGVPAWLTVAAGGGGFTGGVSTMGNTSGQTGSQTGSIFFAGGNNITLSVGTAAGGAQTITISGAAAGGAQTAISSVAVGGTTYTSGSIQFINSNNFTFLSTTGQGILGSFSVPATSSISGTGIVSISVNGSTISIGAPAYSAGISGGNTAGNTGTVSNQIVFAGGNNVTVSGSTNAAGMTVTISGPNTAAVPTSYVSNVNGSSGQISLNVGSSLSSSTAGSSITFGLASNITTALQSAGAYLTTAAQSSVSNISAIYAATNNTGGGTATLSGGVSFTNANSITFYTSAGNAIAASFSTSQSVQTQASGNIVGSGFTTNATAGSVLVGTLNSAGLNLGVPAWLTVAAGGGGFTGGVSTMGNTSGQTGSQTGSIFFAGGNNITLSVGTAAGGAQTITISGAAAGGAQTAISSVGVGGTTYTSGQIQFVNSNNFTFLSTTGQGIVGSFSTSQSNQTGNLYVTANTTQLSSTAGIDHRSLSFAGAGIASVGVSNGVVVVSVPSGGAAAYSATWFQPEVLGATITSSHGNGTMYIRPFELKGYQNYDYLMLQQSMVTSATTVSFSASNSTAANFTSGGTGSWGQSGTILLFSRVNTNVTNASYNSIISFDSKTYFVGGGYSATLSNLGFGVGSSSGGVTMTTAGGVSFIQNIDSVGGFTTTATTTSGTVQFSSSSTNQNSFSTTFGFSFINAHMTGMRPLFVPGTSTNLNAGGYWLGLIQSSQTGSTGYSFQRAVISAASMLYFTGSNQGSYLEMGSPSNIASSNYRLGFGSYSASSNTTAAIPLSAITSMVNNASLWFAIVGQTR